MYNPFKIGFWEPRERRYLCTCGYSRKSRTPICIVSIGGIGMRKKTNNKKRIICLSVLEPMINIL
jgi:hypothetical protein